MTDTKITYACSKCRKEGVKLWRQYNTFLDHIELLCHDCALVDQAEWLDWNIPGGCQVGNLIPAVPTVEMDTFWGYTSSPEGQTNWWFALPSTWVRTCGGCGVLAESGECDSCRAKWGDQ